ncbi:MAG: cache domain-containing protein [Nitrospiraceae bacterium]|nr:cache domain-containing protein [Nitrospiraceae bacterium]
MKAAWIVVLFLAISVPAPAAEVTSEVPHQSGVNTEELRLLLNAFTALGEGQIEGVVRGLRLLAATAEVQSGKWEEMKGLLSEFGDSGIKAAAVWFALPDGSYYTAEKGPTGLNLKDRPYFPRLLAGKVVAGDLVVSKSTEKRTAVVAVPVRSGGKIVGALGVSLSIGEISRTLDRQMSLPKNMVFYALDPGGRTSLHRDVRLLFEYPSDMGSKSLSEKVREMLSKPEGIVYYDFRGKKTVLYKKGPLTGWTFAVGVSGTAR